MKNFPHYTQLDSRDCGPTCLRMIAKYYGKYYTQQFLREKCFITRSGVSMLGISDGAETIGFRTRGVSLSFDQLRKDVPLPCILHWNKRHFVVCYKIKNTHFGDAKIYIADPAAKKYVYNKTDFLKCWLRKSSDQDKKGLALLLIPGPDFNSIKEDEKISTKKGLYYYLRYLTPFRSQFAQIIISMIIGSLLQLIVPFLTQAMVDVGIKDGNLDFIMLILIAQFVLFISQLSIGFIRSWILLHINSRIDISLISDYLLKLMKLPLRYFDSKNTGDILQRIGDHGRIKSFLMGSSINVVFSFFNFVIFGTILLYFSARIFAIFIVGNTLYLLWILGFMRFRRFLDIKRFNQSAKEQTTLIELIQGMQEIKMNNSEKQKRWKWERIQANLFHIAVKGLTINQIQNAGSVFFSQTTSITISYIAAKTVVEGDMTLGMMMSLTYIIGQVAAPISDFIGFAHSYQDAKISLERLNEINEKETEDDCFTSKVINLPEDRSLSLEHVSFSYNGADRNYALDDVSLKIPANKITAIVGASGSGKTTILKLLQGFYEPNNGIIKVGVHQLSNINPHLWREKIGSVMQDSYIFSDTIANNIAMDDDIYDSVKLRHAIEVANIQDFIDSLPQGIKTPIGMEGSGLSQGQRQRILIARAVYKNPEFIFLDEATNSLDASNESIIMNNLNDFYQGKTVLIVAHRLSTITNADNIVVLEKGKILEQGSHSYLLEKKGAYYNLIKNQLKNMINEK